MKEKQSQVNWEKFSKTIDQVLGQEFWDDMHHVIPKRGPAYDLYDAESHLVVIVDLPGLASTEHLTLKQNGTNLILEGHVPPAYQASEQQTLHKERFQGHYKRTIRIPFHFTADEVTSSYKNGILEIRIQKNKDEDTIPIQMPKVDE